MNRQREQVATVGIIGGLGPLAHIVFEQRLLAESSRRGAEGDSDHPVWILVNATDVPDRSQAIAGAGQACTDALVRHGRRLEAAGADFIVVACNTAHAFRRDVQDRLPLLWIDLIDCTVESLILAHPGARRIGLLATDGTLSSDLYQSRLRERGLVAIAPELGSSSQRRIMNAIYAPGWGIKASGLTSSSRARATVLASIESLAARGAELVILGCTELSVAVHELPPGQQPALPCVDPLDVAAELVLDLSFGSAHRRPQLSLAAITHQPRTDTR